VDRKDFGKKIKVTKSRGHLHLKEINELGEQEQQKTECSVFSEDRPTTKDNKKRHKKNAHQNLTKVKLEPISHDAQLEESDPLAVLSKQRSSLDRKLPPMELNTNTKATRFNGND